MKWAVTSLQSRSSEITFICLSDSNTVFINTILEHHGLANLFSTINTNPSHFSPSNSNCLLVGRRVPQGSPNQHSCKAGCPVQLCKGNELSIYITNNGGWDAYSKVVYIGDGAHDFCPLLRMRKEDLFLVRKDMGLHAKVTKDGEERGLKADVKYWTGAWEVEEWVKNASVSLCFVPDDRCYACPQYTHRHPPFLVLDQSFH